MVVTAPSVEHKYNETTSGLDLGDQLLLTFLPHFKCIKLWRKILLNLLTTATGIQRVVFFRMMLVIMRRTFLSCFCKVWFVCFCSKLKWWIKDECLIDFFICFSNAYIVLCEKSKSIDCLELFKPSNADPMILWENRCIIILVI